MLCRNLSFEGINVRLSEIYRYMGYKSHQPDPLIQEAVVSGLSEVEKICKPRFGYKVFESQGVFDKTILVNEITFKTGGILTPYFKEATHFAFFIATSGVEFGEWLKGKSQSSDILDQFVGDAIGSELAESTARTARHYMEEELRKENLRCSNSYSPGYCGWHIREQKLLFSLLGSDSPCGVTLSDSCLMTPMKSVSGLVALGPEMVKGPYSCEICSKKDCYKRFANL